MPTNSSSFDEGWSSTWDGDGKTITPPQPTPEENALVKRAKFQYRGCNEWEAQARTRWDYDYKFANGDCHNFYQWDSDLRNQRELEDRPCLTINKTRQHNLMIVNDAKQNKPGVRIRPVGDEATYEAAQIYQELIYHIEYISNAENVYDSAVSWQVDAGMGYWRVVTDFIGTRSFDQEIYIRRIKDPRSVYLDPDINEVDGSDARFGFIFEDVPKDLFREQYPEFASIASQSVLGNDVGSTDGWITRDLIRVAEYYVKEQKKDKLITFVKNVDSAEPEQLIKQLSELDNTEKLMYREIKKNKQAQVLYQFRERDIITDEIHWYKIAGDRIIDDKPWPGKYIPIVRLPGNETIIDGMWDCKGHTRALINAQQIYNYTSSANVEYGALQTKAPWIAASAAIEGYEEYYKTANSINHSYIPFNHIDEDGNTIPPPQRPQPPQPGPAYTQQMQIAQNEMMMVSGQYQAQFGEAENAKSGVAINARQRQGDRATYHFIDNQAIAIRFTGKIIIDLITKVYDTKRMRLITGSDGTVMNVTIDPKAKEGYEEGEAVKKYRGQLVKEILFNPNIGIFDIQADTGPSYATKRMEAAAVLTQIASSDKDFMKIGGDVYFKTLDFPNADTLAERYRKMLPPGITGEGPDPKTEELMHQASDHIEQLTSENQELKRQLEEKQTGLSIQARKQHLEENKTMTQTERDNYEAETRRLTAIGNAGPAVSVEQLQPILHDLLQQMIRDGSLDVSGLIGVHQGGTVAGAEETPTGEAPSEPEAPPMPGATKHGKDWYVQQNGQTFRIDQNA